MDPRQTATEIFLAGLEGVKPENLIKRFISIEQHNLQIENFQFDLSTIANIYIVGVGKASAAMAQTIESILGSRITEGHIITKYEHSVPLQFIGITEAGHPVPDENGIKGTEIIMSIAKKAEAHFRNQSAPKQPSQNEGEISIDKMPNSKSSNRYFLVNKAIVDAIKSAIPTFL